MKVGAQVSGGKGDDSYVVDSVWDRIYENSNEGYDTVLVGAGLGHNQVIKILGPSAENIEQITFIG